MSTGPCRSPSAHSQMNKIASLGRKSRILFHIRASVAIFLRSFVICIFVCSHRIFSVVGASSLITSLLRVWNGRLPSYTIHVIRRRSRVSRCVRVQRDHNGIYIYSYKYLLTSMCGTRSPRSADVCNSYSHHNTIFPTRKICKQYSADDSVYCFALSRRNRLTLSTRHRQRPTHTNSILIFSLPLCELWEASSGIRILLLLFLRSVFPFFFSS